jgi:hypothetical protein
MSATTIPVTVAEDAAARVAQLGMQREFEQLIEHAKQVMPHLRAIRVTLEYTPYCPHEDPGVVIWAHRSDSPAPGTLDPITSEYSEWKIQTFPPEVGIHFTVLSVYGGADGW